MSTTIEVEKETAVAIKRAYPGLTYDEAIRRMLAAVMSQDTRITPFRKTINPATWNEEKSQAPFRGVITAVHMHFPAGTNGLVEVRVVVDGKGGGYTPVVPSKENSFIALDDETLDAIGLEIPVEAGDTIRTEWWNYDGGFSHTVPVEVIFQKRG